jgi:hypothetical protein
MTEKRFHEIMCSGGFTEMFLDGGYIEIYEFAKPHFTKPKLYQARVEIPEPVRDAGEMKYGQRYFMPMLTSREKFSYSYWHSDSDDLFRLEQGLIYLKEEDVIKRTDAGLQVEYAE